MIKGTTYSNPLCMFLFNFVKPTILKEGLSHLTIDIVI